MVKNVNLNGQKRKLKWSRRKFKWPNVISTVECNIMAEKDVCRIAARLQVIPEEQLAERII